MMNWLSKRSMPSPFKKKGRRCRDYPKGVPGSLEDMFNCIDHGKTMKPSKECVPGKWYGSPDPCRNRVSIFGLNNIMNSRDYNNHYNQTETFITEFINDHGDTNRIIVWTENDELYLGFVSNVDGVVELRYIHVILD